MRIFKLFFFVLIYPYFLSAALPLYWWEPDNGTTNFGDSISPVIVEKILERQVERASLHEHKLLAVGSILHFASEGDVIWGSGINGKHPYAKDYSFKHLDVRCVRGPLTRQFLLSFGIEAPEIYGDPGLLMPLLFPEFQKNPQRDYIVIPHISEIGLFENTENVVLPTEPWNVVVQKILESRFVISSSLHGIIIADAFGIPARLLRVTENEPLFKYTDYYLGTGRQQFRYATSIEEALEMKGEALPVCDLDALLNAFPRDLYR